MEAEIVDSTAVVVAKPSSVTLFGTNGPTEVMTTEQTPEQRARAAVRSAIERVRDHPAAIAPYHAVDTALARLCAERYAAGKVAGLKEMGCTQIPWCWSAFRIEERKGGQGDLCYRCRRLEKAEAEYKAAVAALVRPNCESALEAEGR